MRKGSILVAFFLSFTILSNLVQESYEITGILIPRRSHHRDCRRSSRKRGRVHACRRRRDVRQLRPVFMLTERRNFLRYNF